MINVAYALDISGNLNTKGGFTLSGDLICAYGSSELPVYSGPYTVTPSQSTQVLSTQNKKTTSNITINPIPSNYGLITWNGSYLKVS